MKFEEIYERWQGRRLNQAEAAEILNMSERTCRRWRDRYAEAGPGGLLNPATTRSTHARRTSLNLTFIDRSAS